MPKVLSYEADFKGGVQARTKLVVPVLASDPGSPADGWVWVNTTDHVLRYRENGATVTVGTSTLDTEAVIDAVAAAFVAGNNVDITYNDGAGTITVDVESLTSGDISDFTTAVRAAISVTDTATLDLSYSGGAISGAVLDSPLLEGSDKAYYRNTDNHVDGTTNHVFTAADDTKLAGIATGATANDTDANLRARSSHTGTQASSTITQATARILGRVTASAGATEELTADQVTTLLALVAADISDFDSAAVAAVNAGTIDADTLNGSTAAQIQTAVTAAIVDSAPGTLDTLNELAAALGDDANFATTVSTALATKARTYVETLDGGATTEVVTHNLGTRDLHAQVYVNSGNYEDEDYIIQRTSTNTVTVVSEGQNIPSGRRIVITAVGA